MEDLDLNFTELAVKTVHSTPIFDLKESLRQGPDRRQSPFVLVDAPLWANVVAVVPHQGRDCFLMVRQFRHGLGRAVWEFPGGMVDPGEEETAAAARELEEETGWKASRLTFLGRTNPNPAFMTNSVATYRAEGLEPGHRSLDDREFVRVGFLPVDEVLEHMGSGDFDHGIMLMALWFWTRGRLRDNATA